MSRHENNEFILLFCLVCEGFPYIGEYYPKSGYHYHTQPNYDRSYIPYRQYTDTDFNMHPKNTNKTPKLKRMGLR